MTLDPITNEKYEGMEMQRWRVGSDEIECDLEKYCAKEAPASEIPTRAQWQKYLDYIVDCQSKNPREIAIDFVDWIRGFGKREGEI
ncbi:hypothetical protein CCP2SC5_1020010 [Azospirillaceae bacterium]